MFWPSSATPAADAVRSEIFFLGGRHRGEPLAGALSELESRSITLERRRLLNAVVSHLRANPPVATA